MVADLDPVRVEAVELEAVQVAAAIGKGQQTRIDLQVAHVRLDQQRGLVGQVTLLVPLAYGHPLHRQHLAQLAGHQGRRVQQQQAEAGGRIHLATAVHAQGVADQLLAAQAVLDPELAHAAAGQVHPVQATRGTDPGHPVHIKHQPVGSDVRITAALVDAVQLVQAAIAQQVQAQCPLVAQPEHAVHAETHHVHGRTRRTGNLDKGLAGRIETPHPVLGAQPELVIRPALGGMRQLGAWLLPGHVIDPGNASVRLAQLDAAFPAERPDPALVAADQPCDGAGRCRVVRIIVMPAAQAAAAGLEADQLVVGAHPDPALPVLDHRAQPGRAQRLVQVMFDPAAAQVQMIEHPATANHPQAITRGRGHGRGQGVAQPVDAGPFALQLGELAPVGRQVPQAVVHAAKPQPALTILVTEHPRGPYRTPGHRAEHRHIGHPVVVAAQPEPAPGVIPILAPAVLDQQLQCLLVRFGAQPGYLDPARVIDPDHAAAGAHPQAALAVGLQGVDERRWQLLQRQSLEVRTGPARHPVLGPDPELAVIGDQQLADRPRRQRARVAGLGQEGPDAVIGRQTVQPRIFGSEPDRPVGGGGDRPDPVGPHLRVGLLVEIAEIAPVGAEHDQAGRIGADPQLVAGIHMHRPQRVVTQAVFRAPGTEIPPVIAGQAIGTGQPQVTEVVFGQRADVGRGQAIGHRELTQVRLRLQPGLGGHRQRPQASQQHPQQHSATGRQTGAPVARAGRSRIICTSASASSTPVTGLRT